MGYAGIWLHLHGVPVPLIDGDDAASEHFEPLVDAMIVSQNHDVVAIPARRRGNQTVEFKEVDGRPDLLRLLIVPFGVDVGIDTKFRKVGHGDTKGLVQRYGQLMNLEILSRDRCEQAQI